MKRFRPHLIFLPAALLSAGCRATDAHSTTVDVLGSYFPAWMACILLGLVLTLVARQVIIGLKLDVELHAPPLVYFCMMILWTLTVWLVFFKN